MYSFSYYKSVWTALNINVRAFQKIFKLFLQPGRFTYMILALNELIKFFFAQIHSFNFFHWTCLAWLAYIWVGTPSQAGSVEKIETVDLAKKISLTNFASRTWS